MKLEMGTLTNRDKQLLVILGCILVIVGFVFLGIRPLYLKYEDTKLKLQDANAQMTINQKKESLYQSLVTYDEQMKQDAKESTSDFYPMMTSDEIDKLLTDMAVKYNLDAKNLNIQMPEDGAIVVPYIFKDGSAGALSGDASASSGSSSDTTDQTTQSREETQAQSSYGIAGDSSDSAAESTTEASSGSTDAQGEESASSIGIYQADISMQLNGSTESLKRMINALTENYAAIRVTGYFFDENVSVYTDASLNPVISTNKVLNITMEIYMYATQEESELQGASQEGQ